MAQQIAPILMPEETLQTTTRTYSRARSRSYLPYVVALAIGAVGFALWSLWGGQDQQVAPPESQTLETPTLTPPNPESQPVEPVSPTREPPVEVVAQPVTTVEAPAPALPRLRDSDEFVRQQWTLPEPIAEQEDLVARLSVVIANAADGLVPTKFLRTLAPIGKFEITQVGETIYLDPSSYRRYDPYVQWLTQISPDNAATFIALIEPLIVEGLLELGDARSPRSLIAQAIDRVERLPKISQEIRLVSDNAVYAYADPNLEGLPEFEKQMLRLGPENLTRLQGWMSEFNQVYAKP